MLVSQKAKALVAIMIVVLVIGCAGTDLFEVTRSSKPNLHPSVTANEPIQPLIPSPTPTATTPTPTQTPIPTSKPTAAPSRIPTPSPVQISYSFDPTPEPTPTLAPVETPTPTPSPTPTPVPTPVPTPTPKPRGIISITFDDGLACQYTNAFPLMQARNITGTFYVPTGNFTTNSTMSNFNKITPAQLLQMQNAGNEIGSHSVTHPDFTKLTEAQIRQECANSKATLQSYGLTVNNFAYPYGVGNFTYANTIVSQYYRSARIVSFSPMTISNASFQLPGFLAESQGANYTNLLPKLKMMIDYTANNNMWTVFYIHNVSTLNDSVANGGISTDDFTSFLNYAKASGSQILTVNQALDLAKK